MLLNIVQIDWYLCHKIKSACYMHDSSFLLSKNDHFHFKLNKNVKFTFSEKYNFSEYIVYQVLFDKNYLYSHIWIIFCNR